VAPRLQRARATLARLRGPLLALLGVASLVLWQHARLERSHLPYDRFTLPAFDAHAYVAMADHPEFFSVAPWGHRVATPWLVAALPVRNVARGFELLTLGCLILAGVLRSALSPSARPAPWPRPCAIASWSSR
jgi:hypothetical protein